MVEFLADYGNIITFLIGLAALAGFIWRAIQWMNQQADKKEETRLKLEDEKAKVIKQDIESRALELKHDTEDVAEDVKKEVELRADIIKREIEGTAKNLREYTEQVSGQLFKKIAEVDEKVMRMLDDLTKRADMTNGNVKMIRNEIADVQDDVQSLWEMIEDTNIDMDSKQRQALKPRIAKRRGLQAVERRKKRSQIANDSEEQEMVKHRY